MKTLLVVLSILLLLSGCVGKKTEPDEPMEASLASASPLTLRIDQLVSKQTSQLLAEAEAALEEGRWGEAQTLFTAQPYNSPAKLAARCGALTSAYCGGEDAYERALAAIEIGEPDRALSSAYNALGYWPDAQTQQLLLWVRIPDYRWFFRPQRSEYQYTLIWNPAEPGAPYEADWVEMTTIDRAERERLEALVFAFASHYPPEYFNARISSIAVYHDIFAPELDGEGQPLRDELGDVALVRSYGLLAGDRILISDRYRNESAMLRALIGLMSQYELDHDLNEQRDVLYEQIAAYNSAAYLLPAAGVKAESQLSGFDSEESQLDYLEGYARSEGRLNARYDIATLMEKLVLGDIGQYQNYPLLYEKLQWAMSLRAQLHPAFTPYLFAQTPVTP